MKSPKVIADVPAGYLNSEQLCTITGLSYEAVRRATARGELVAVKIAGRLLYPISKLPGHEPATTHTRTVRAEQKRRDLDAEINDLVHSRG